jgi:hypothetical protein
MGHCLHRLTAVVRVGADRAVTHQLVGRERMLPFRHPLKGLLVDITSETPVAGELPVPRAANLLGGRVVVLASVLKFFPVIGARLARAEGLRDGEHRATYLNTGSGHGPGGTSGHLRGRVASPAASSRGDRPDGKAGSDGRVWADDRSATATHGAGECGVRSTQSMTAGAMPQCCSRRG